MIEWGRIRPVAELKNNSRAHTLTLTHVQQKEIVPNRNK